MKHTCYTCDQCNESIGTDITESRRDNGAVSITIHGRLSEDDKWHQSKDKEFCNTKCMAEYLSTFSKELVAQFIVEQ